MKGLLWKIIPLISQRTGFMVQELFLTGPRRAELNCRTDQPTQTEIFLSCPHLHHIIINSDRYEPSLWQTQQLTHAMGRRKETVCICVRARLRRKSKVCVYELRMCNATLPLKTEEPQIFITSHVFKLGQTGSVHSLKTSLRPHHHSHNSSVSWEDHRWSLSVARSLSQPIGPLLALQLGAFDSVVG